MSFIGNAGNTNPDVTKEIDDKRYPFLATLIADINKKTGLNWHLPTASSFKVCS